MRFAANVQISPPVSGFSRVVLSIVRDRPRLNQSMLSPETGTCWPCSWHHRLAPWRASLNRDNYADCDSLKADSDTFIINNNLASLYSCYEFTKCLSFHKRRRRGARGHVPPSPPQKKIGKIFSGNYYVKLGHFRAKTVWNSEILLTFRTNIFKKIRIFC